MIPKYIVFNINIPDKNGKALPVGQGNDLDELLSAYHGKAYQIMKVKTLSDREECKEKAQSWANSHQEVIEAKE